MRAVRVRGCESAHMSAKHNRRAPAPNRPVSAHVRGVRVSGVSVRGVRMRDVRMDDVSVRSGGPYERATSGPLACLRLCHSLKACAQFFSPIPDSLGGGLLGARRTCAIR